MVTQASDLLAIRTALLTPFQAAAASLGAAGVVYQAMPQGKPWSATAAYVRASLALPSRLQLGVEADPLVQQRGTLTLQWMFPRTTGMADIVAAVEGTAALYREKTIDGGITLTGDAQTQRIGVEGDRIRWDVTIGWQTQRVEPSASALSPILGPRLPTTSQALATVRNIWLQRIEQANTIEQWAGLRTFYDDVGPFAAAPALPWCGYWCSTFNSVAQETSGPTDLVLGRAIVQLHTDKSLGSEPADVITQRIIAEHNRIEGGVAIGVADVAGPRVISPAGTLQTTMRVPFRFERLRNP